MKEFVSDFRDYVGTNMEITPTTALSDIPEWDSLTSMSIVTLLSTSYGLNLTLSDLRGAKTVGDIMSKAGISR